MIFHQSIFDNVSFPELVQFSEILSSFCVIARETGYLSAGMKESFQLDDTVVQAETGE